MPQAVALLGLILFMVHEFDEIILVMPYIRSAGAHPGRKSLWWTNRAAYPSCEAVAFCIAEEFVVVGAIFTVATIWSAPELTVGTIIALSAHLLGHFGDAVRTRRLVPGSLTAMITLPLNLLIVIWCALVTQLSWPWTLGWAVGVGVVLIGNLQLMLRLAVPKLDRLVQRFYVDR